MTPEEVSKMIWEEFIRRLRLLREKQPKKTLEEIGEMCGVKKATVLRWLNGTIGEKVIFSDMLKYMQAVGMEIEGFSPKPIDERLVEMAAERDKTLKELERSQEELKECREMLASYKAKWEGHLETVRAQSGNLHSYSPTLENDVAKGA